ncbi:hypothetical protein [Cryobacterium sp. TMS1-13-1]|uniref:hypothetical protein n=1 Tax=Cryobacterium sp. TMS1-13-1 TaxID=1259220 RepID=UPI00106CC14A|nr:hypothetical protein [Cryobacterium sp. TMS1-13-1]TFD20157.1 hypothetical protein E3T31_14620 [Cryobacterium sp. TMS1-13-1]
MLSAGQHTVTLSGTVGDGSAVSRVASLTVSASGTLIYLSDMEADAVTTVAASLASTSAGGGAASGRGG